MRKLVFVILVSCLLFALLFVGKESIPPVKASPDVYQGDLVLTGNNVTVIEGGFDINGSIIVEENATLILRNAVLNFTQTYDRQFNMTFRNPVAGNPRLNAENATITSYDYLDVRFYGNSSVILNEFSVWSSVYLDIFDDCTVSLANSTKMYGRISAYDFVNIDVSRSSVGRFRFYAHSVGTISDSTISSELSLHGSSAVNISSSYIRPWIISHSVNSSITGLEPGFFDYWNYRANCSVDISPTGEAPDVILNHTDVGDWSFSISGSSNTTVLHSTIRDLWAYDSSVVHIYISTITSDLRGYLSPYIYFYNSTTDNLRSWYSSKLWLVNSTSNTCDIYDQSEVYVSWYLEVHVVDSEGTDVPSANVTATYPNATVVESKLADANGWATFTLMEKMMNATGDYPVGNYTVEATYDIYSDGTTANMTENQQITLTLADFVIPEFPSFLVLPLFMMATLLAIINYKRKDST